MLWERRNWTALARIQCALAGGNAHINHDLPFAIVRTGAGTLLAFAEGRAALVYTPEHTLARVDLDRWFGRIFVSSEIGAAKPSPAFFSVVLDGLQCLPAEIVMVGDSYDNDVRGARAAGLWTIWYDPAGDPAPDHAHDHDARIADMNSLPFVLHRLEMWVERSGRHMLAR